MITGAAQTTKLVRGLNQSHLPARLSQSQRTGEPGYATTNDGHRLGLYTFVVRLWA